jgi:fatty acid desaturase
MTLPVLSGCSPVDCSVEPRHGSARLRATIAGELLMNAVWSALVFGVWHNRTLCYHAVAMTVGQCMTAYFAVWTVHHPCDRTTTSREPSAIAFKDAITFHMFLHVEHHLFSRVPTCHLPKLSERIDDAAPELRSKIVF